MKTTVAGPRLLAILSTVPDPRQARGRGQPLPALLALATAAMLHGARSLDAIAHWGRLQEPGVVQALGFTRAQTPAVSTLPLVFKDLDVAAFAAALRRWAQQRDVKGRPIALDGTAVRGSHGAQLPGVDLVAADADAAGLVLAQAGGQAGCGRGRIDGRDRIAAHAAACGPSGDR